MCYLVLCTRQTICGGKKRTEICFDAKITVLCIPMIATTLECRLWTRPKKKWIKYIFKSETKKTFESWMIWILSHFSSLVSFIRTRRKKMHGFSSTANFLHRQFFCIRRFDIVLVICPGHRFRCIFGTVWGEL